VTNIRDFWFLFLWMSIPVVIFNPELLLCLDCNGSGAVKDRLFGVIATLGARCTRGSCRYN
jgi:hypothetical protein